MSAPYLVRRHHRLRRHDREAGLHDRQPQRHGLVRLRRLVPLSSRRRPHPSGDAPPSTRPGRATGAPVTASTTSRSASGASSVTVRCRSAAIAGQTPPASSGVAADPSRRPASSVCRLDGGVVRTPRRARRRPGRPRTPASSRAPVRASLTAAPRGAGTRRLPAPGRASPGSTPPVLPGDAGATAVAAAARSAAAAGVGRPAPTGSLRAAPDTPARPRSPASGSGEPGRPRTATLAPAAARRSTARARGPGEHRSP